MADSEELAREAHQSLSTSMRKMASSTVPQRPLNEETQSDDRDRDHFDHQSSSVLSQRPSHSLAAPNNTGPLFSRMCTQAPDQDVSIAHSLATRTHRTQSRTSRTSVGTASFQLPDFEVDFVQNDPENPKDWPLWKRSLTIAVMSFSTWVVVLYSSSYTAGIAGMMEELDVTSKPVATLGVTSYLLGLALGSLVLAPMSEIYGRRLVYMISYALFGILVLPSALATTLQEIIVARFFSAFFGAAMISNSPGTINDISTEERRTLALSIWSIGPINGPVTGPLIGGFVYQYLGWRWTNWLVMIFAGSGWLFLFLTPETYAPKILKDRVLKIRLETGDERWWCRYDEKLCAATTIKINLSRPFVMTSTEPILWFWDLYIGILYATLYLCFVAYPLIFTGYRGWEPGFSGLAFTGIGFGNLITICSEPLIRRLINMHSHDHATGRVPPEAMVSVACISALLVPIGQLWFAWTSMPVTIHWIWPILAGVPFGAGQSAIFIYANTYIASSYGIYAASALSGNGAIRSIFGGLLPLAGPAMYKTLTPRWAGTLLGVLELLLVPIPFAFYFRGREIRERSPMIRKMRIDQELIEQRAKGQVRKVNRNADQREISEQGKETKEKKVTATSLGDRAYD